MFDFLNITLVKLVGGCLVMNYNALSRTPELVPTCIEIKIILEKLYGLIEAHEKDPSTPFKLDLCMRELLCIYTGLYCTTSIHDGTGENSFSDEVKDPISKLRQVMHMIEQVPDFEMPEWIEDVERNIPTAAASNLH